MNEATIVQRRPGIQVTDSGERLYLVDEHGGYLFGLNASGRAIWEHIADPVGIDTLCARLAQRFSLPEPRVLCDVLEFLKQLAAARLIDWHDGSSTGTDR